MKKTVESLIKTKTESMIFRKNWATDTKKMDFNTDLGVWPSDDNTLCFRDANGLNRGHIDRKDVPALIIALREWVNRKGDG